MAHRTPPRQRKLLVLTNTRRSEMTVCAFREFLSYDMGLRPWRAAPPLVFGDLWHRLMEATYRLHAWWETEPMGPGEPELTTAEVYETVLGQLDHDPVPTYQKDGQEIRIVPPGGVLDSWMAERVNATRPDGDGGVVSVHDPAELAEMQDMAKAMFWGYLNRWWETDRAKYRVLGVELRLRHPILTGSGAASSVWDYQGDLDLVFQERSTNNIVIADHKSCTGTPKDNFIEYHVSPQVDGYAWLYWRTTGVRPAAIIYRASRKAIPKKPKRNQCPKKPKDGNHVNCDTCKGTMLGPLSASSCDTTPEIYESAINEAAAAGFPPTQQHLDNLAALRSEGTKAWFDQYTRWLTNGDAFRRFERETYLMTKRKNQMLKGGPVAHHRADNPKVCTLFGRPCAYMPICERQVIDVRQLWETDGTLRETYQQIVPDK